MILNRFACNWIYLDSRFVDKIRLAHLLAIPFLPTPTLAFSIDNTSATTATPVVTHILSCSREFQIVHAAIQSISWRITRNRSSSVGCQTVAPVRFRLVAISIYSTWFRTGFLDDFFVSERGLEVLEGAGFVPCYCLTDSLVVFLRDSLYDCNSPTLISGSSLDA